MDRYEELVTKARESYEKGNLEEAIKLYEEAFKIKIDVADFLMLGFIYIDTNKLQEALKVFDTLKDSGVDFFEVHFGYANIYERMGKREEAINLYEQVIQEQSDFEMAYFKVAYLYDEISEENKEQFNGDNTTKAVKNYLKCIELNDNNFWAHINVGSIFERFDYDKEALQHFLKAYDIDKDQRMVCYNLGVVYSKMKKYDLAVKYYKEELSKKEPFLSTYYNLGIVYKDGYKDYDKAQYYYLLGLEKNKDDYNIWYNLGCVHALKNDFENAFECFKYIYYKNRKYLNLLKTDNELEEFRKSEYYEKLLKVL